MSLAFINLRACSKAAFRFFSVIASACCAASFIGLETIATDLFADSINDEIALSAWSTLFTAKSRTCGGTSIVTFWSDMSLSLQAHFCEAYHVESRASCRGTYELEPAGEDWTSNLNASIKNATLVPPKRGMLMKAA